jgi:hypothetical protein
VRCFLADTPIALWGALVGSVVEMLLAVPVLGENGPSAYWPAMRERKLPASVRVFRLALCTHRVSSIKMPTGVRAWVGLVGRERERFFFRIREQERWSSVDS